MLLQLNIQNFAIVKQLSIEWHQGMTTITGETGAGKSIAIDALGLCLGDRATTNVVRPNSKKAELSASFDVQKNLPAQKWLKQHELTFDDDCILRRVVSQEGRSRAFINGSQVPLTQLKELGQLLLNIHGQHDHQLIVKTSEQRRLLDNYAKHQNLLDDVKYYYQQYRSLNSELAQLESSKQQREAQQQLLEYQVRELDEFSLQQDEFNQLEQDFKKHSHAQHILSESLHALHLLNENEQFNIVDNLQKTADTLNELSQYDEELKTISELLQESLIQVQEASNDLRYYHDKLDLDPEAYQAIEERYSLAVQLAKKHQISPEELVYYHQSLSQQLAAISSDDTRLNNIYEELERTKQAYLDASNKLSQSRQKSAKTLGKRISKSIQELNMPHGQFAININQQTSALSDITLTSHGLDEIEFLVQINPGQSLEAMHKVASGGELSRISLAMQVILAEKVISPTLIFDEVDVGISGPTAAMVGAKLQQLGQSTQVICVTHLPQVACKGDQQLFVAKLTDGEHTETTVTELTEQGRIKELARLLAGDKISEHSLANAKELLAS